MSPWDWLGLAAYVFYVRWLVSRTNIRLDGHLLDHADDDLGLK